MKQVFFLTVMFFTIFNCKQTDSNKQSNKDNNTSGSDTVLAPKERLTGSQNEAYEMMKQFCFSCHLPQPDPSKRESMIAPPMRNVQQHYKSTYPEKEAFVKAVVDWVSKPEEEKVLMPGAVRKFNLMPPLPIGNDKLKKIATALYEHNFGQMTHGKRRFKNTSTGAKQTLEQADIQRIHRLIDALNQSKPENIAAYRRLGKDVFEGARSLLLNKKYTGETLQQIQFFFHDTEGLMHGLMSVNSIEEGNKYQKELQTKFASFDKYFGIE